MAPNEAIWRAETAARREYDREAAALASLLEDGCPEHLAPLFAARIAAAYCPHSARDWKETSEPNRFACPVCGKVEGDYGRKIR